MKVSFRLSDADREKWGGDEWTTVDTDKLPDLGYDRLDELERDMKRYDKTSITKILAWEWPHASMLGQRGMAWLARQVCGFTEPAWPDFKPDVLGGLTFEINRADDESADADPPAGGSSEPPSAKSARSKRA